MRAPNPSHALVGLALVLGCAATSMSSFRDPDYNSRSFKRVLVLANVRDLYWRGQIEGAIVSRLRANGVQAQGSMLLLPPTRELSQEQTDSTFKANGIEGFLVVSVGDTGSQTVHVPVLGTTSVSEGSARRSGSSVTFDVTTRTSAQGGYDVKKPWAYICTNLFDTEHGRMAWIATSMSGGNAYSSMVNVVNSYCGKVAGRLLGERLVIPSLPDAAVLLAPISPYVIQLKDGRLIGASALHPSATGTLRYTGAEGQEVFVSMGKVKSIWDRYGVDWTRS